MTPAQKQAIKQLHETDMVAILLKEMHAEIYEDYGTADSMQSMEDYRGERRLLERFQGRLMDKLNELAG